MTNMEYIEATKEEIEKAKECCKTLNCEGCPLKESDYCIEQIKSDHIMMRLELYGQQRKSNETGKILV